MANAPYEQKYNVLKKTFTNHKGMYRELEKRYGMLMVNNYDLATNLAMATQFLLQEGYRRLPDGRWTDEPFIDSTLETDKEGGEREHN